LFRRLARSLIRQETACFDADLTQWHHYKLVWESGGVHFLLDNSLIFESARAPSTPLGIVMWIDNQFLATTADGRFDYGYLETVSPAWIEIKDFRIESLEGARILPARKTGFA
jgi:hypothetical protein